jgi:hypothetical protein
VSLELLERVDPLSGLRNKLREVAGARGEWAGIPMPLDGEELIVEPSHPLAEVFNKKRVEAADDNDGWTLRNAFWSWTKRSTILVMEKDGKIDFGILPGVHSLNTLGTLIKHHPFKQYLLTGMFLETSKRSGITYMFRKLRPTVAITMSQGDSRILCALCMHPIAYYEDSWAGAMCPTDDVIAHLMLMRADEHMFWKRCNQHPAHMPQAGL